MTASSLLSFSLFEKAATVLGRPKLRLHYDDASANCHQEVSDRLTSDTPFLRGLPGTYAVERANASGPHELIANAVYLRVTVENIGKSKPADGCRVFVTSVAFGEGKTGTPASQLQWAHVARLEDRFTDRTLHPRVPLTVDVCRVNAYEQRLVLLSEHADRGGGRFEASGLYDVEIRAVGTNWVSPGWITLRVHFDAENFRNLRADVISARGDYRLA